MILRTLLLLCTVIIAVSAMPMYQQAFYAAQSSPNLVYGDVMLTTEEKIIRHLPESISSKIFIVDESRKRWPNNIVPFAFSKHKKEEEAKLRYAMKIIEVKTCFKFVEKRPEHQDYLLFEPSGSCFSYIGKIGGKQIISLFGWCSEMTPAVHDIIHALGAHHEHQRSDRDKYIDVNFNNVDPNMQWVYDKVDQYIDAKKFPYDLKSIMHYHGYSYSKRDKNGKDTITMTYKGTKKPIEYNTVMSAEDIRKLNELGNCYHNNKHGKK